MRHRINPKVDCVFKALLGAETNRALLIHFLNAVLGDALSAPITEAEILNPYNERESLDDKLSVVDVKARDSAGRLFQIEIQLLSHRDLPARILYGWADLYSAQLQSGEDFGKLRPTYAIWLLAEDLLRDDTEYAHCYRLRDERGRVFLDHGGIWLLELGKFATDLVETEQQRWLKFFTEAERLDDAVLPEWMQTAEMRQAMSTLKGFSEKERAYHAYQARQNFLREQRSIQRHLDSMRAETEQQRAEAEQQRAEAERQRAEAERQRAETERQRAEAERQRAEAEQERNAKETALAEIERLQRLLRGDSGQDR